MKAQLVKRQDRFDLYNESDGSKIASTSPNPMGKLSLKNCEAIENGYDLDDLAKYFAYNQSNEDSQEDFAKFAFIEGFQKALSILGDKRFSEEDLKFMFQLGFNLDNAISRDEYDIHIQSLQQTEWDVTFNPEEKDSEGCIILKRIK